MCIRDRAKGEGKGRVWCTIHAQALPVQQFFKALRYRELRPAEQENGTVPVSYTHLDVYKRQPCRGRPKPRKTKPTNKKGLQFPAAP